MFEFNFKVKLNIDEQNLAGSPVERKSPIIGNQDFRCLLHFDTRRAFRNAVSLISPHGRQDAPHLIRVC